MSSLDRAANGVGTFQEYLETWRVSSRGDPFSPAVTASLIDHTLLRPEASRSQIEALCAEAVEFGFKSVCVNPYWITTAVDRLRGSGVKVCTVIGFPLGATSAEIKAYETQRALGQGAEEIDMVLNLGAVKSGQWQAVEEEMRGVAARASGRALTKAILETCLLTADEKRQACRVAMAAGMDFVKTSTGFSLGGATAEDVSLLRAVVGARLGVKAAGGVRCLDDLKQMVAAGATRIGTSAGVAILRENRKMAENLRSRA